jgi:hypothetical protein
MRALGRNWQGESCGAFRNTNAVQNCRGATMACQGAEEVRLPGLRKLCTTVRRVLVLHMPDRLDESARLRSTKSRNRHAVRLRCGAQTFFLAAGTNRASASPGYRERFRRLASRLPSSGCAMTAGCARTGLPVRRSAMRPAHCHVRRKPALRARLRPELPRLC